MKTLQCTSWRMVLLVGLIAAGIAGGWSTECQCDPARPVSPAGSAAKRPVAVKAAKLRFVLKSDLTVSISAPAKAVAGTDISVKVTVKNNGPGEAHGTLDVESHYAYMVDVVLSTDTNIPVKWAVQPVYMGKTKDDFVEDMLMLGARISRTNSISAGQQVVYSAKTYIPRNTAPGLYYIGAVVDPGKNVSETNENNNVGSTRIEIVGAGIPEVRPPEGTGVWIMPYGVGGTTVNTIKPNGLVDYTDWISGLAMSNAPFGGRLGFRHAAAAAVPTPAIKYYRWMYKHEAEPQWHEFTESVGVHYVKEMPSGPPVFPVYVLGPKVVNGMYLYEFRPHHPPEPGAYWPTTDIFGDIYSGFLNTAVLREGRYLIRLEIYNEAGAKVGVGPGTFQFIIPHHIDSAGTVWTQPAPAAQVIADGFEFALHIDNRACTASIGPPLIGDTGAVDECGFLRFDAASTDPVKIAFEAAHPANFAVFDFAGWRGADPVTALAAGGEISAADAGSFTGNGSGGFTAQFPRSALLGAACQEGAFSLNLHVYAKATTGWGHRISSLDAHDVRAFALAAR